MKIITNFVETLRALMQDRGLTAKKLAADIKIDPTSISKWFKFKSIVSLKHLILLADYFGCSIEFLLGRNDIYLHYTPQPIVPFSQNIRKIIAEKGYTRYSFVNQTRFTDAHIYQWDKGTIPKLPMLTELADLFGCTTDYLAGRER